MRIGSLLRSKLFIGISAGVVAAAVAVAAIVLNNKKEESFRVVKVFEKTGTSVVKRPDAGDLDTYVGMNLENGDTVCTLAESTMHINLDDSKYVMMEPDTELDLAATGDSQNGKTRLVLKSGSVLNEITKPLSSSSSYEVAAPKATMAVRGTSFRTAIERDQNGNYIIKVYTFHGEVKITLLDQDGKETDKTVTIGEDRCVFIKTVHNQESDNDPIVDGISFFVHYDNRNGELVRVFDGEDPTMAINYTTLSKDILKHIYLSDSGNEIKLSTSVLAKIIAALDGDLPIGNSTTTTTTTTVTTTAPATTTEPPETTTTTAEPEETTATTTTPKEEATTTTTPATSAATTTTPKKTTTTTTRRTTTTTKKTTTAPVKTYKVKFVDHNGSILKTQVVNSGAGATAPTNYTKSYKDSKTGYTMLFNGWSTSFSNVRADLTVKAVYKEKPRYTVKFFNYNGTLISSQTIESGGSAAAPASGYSETYNSSNGVMVFTGWKESYTNVTSDLTIYPAYSRGYKLKLMNYSLGGTGTDVSPSTAFLPGKSYTLPSYSSGFANYNVAWFKANSGVTSSTPVMSVTVSSDELNNIYYCVPYKTITVTQHEFSENDSGSESTKKVTLLIFKYDGIYRVFDAGTGSCAAFSESYTPSGLDVPMGMWRFYDSNGNVTDLGGIYEKSLMDISSAECFKGLIE